MKTSYQGGCHCGAIRFQADIDLQQGTLRCNCTFCLKIRCWAVMVRPDDFKLLKGEDALSTYQFGAMNELHLFCRFCGVRPYGIGHSPRIGKFIGISVNSLDGISAEDLARLPITYVDGANDAWGSAPVVTAHL